MQSQSLPKRNGRNGNSGHICGVTGHCTVEDLLTNKDKLASDTQQLVDCFTAKAGCLPQDLLVQPHDVQGMVVILRLPEEAREPALPPLTPSQWLATT